VIEPAEALAEAEEEEEEEAEEEEAEEEEAEEEEAEEEEVVEEAEEEEVVEAEALLFRAAAAAAPLYSLCTRVTLTRDTRCCCPCRLRVP